MASAQTIWGIDVGRCALKAVRLRSSSDGSVELLGQEYIEHGTILTAAETNRHELIAAALEKFLSQNDLSKDKVVVGVPGQHTLARFTKLPPVAPKRVPDIVKYEADQQIPFDMDEVIWDYQTFEQEGLPDIEVGIFAMKRELLREHLLDFEQASIEPLIVQSGPLALYNAAKFDGLLGANTTVLLDIGAENADLVIATEGSLWTRTISIGGNAFTEALVKAFKLSFSKAESLKRTADSSKYRRQIFQAMRPIFADLVQELQRSIGFYSSTHRDSEIDKVVAVGNAFKLPGLQKYLQQNLGMDVASPSGFNKVGGAEGSSDAQHEQILSFFVAYGLALQGLDQVSVKSNLLPTELAKQTVWRKKRPAFAATAACLLAAGASIWFRQTADMSALASGTSGSPHAQMSIAQAVQVIDSGPSLSGAIRDQASEINAACETLKKELNRLSNDGKTERERTEQLIDLQHNKTMVPRILEVIHQSIPTHSGALASASNQEEILQIIQSGTTPRAARTQVVIDSINLQYEPDLDSFEWPESLVKSPPRITEPGGGGFEVKIKCRTSNADGPKFIGETLMASLRELGRKPDTNFYFDRVYLINGGKFEPQGTAKKGAGGDGVSAINRDPITGESMLSDWQFEVWADVILEEFPELEEDDEG